MATLKLGSTTAITESGGALTIASSTLTTPTIASMANCTFPDDHILYFKHTVLAAGGGSHTGTSYATTGGVTVTVPAVTCNAMDSLTIIFNGYAVAGQGNSHTDMDIRGDRTAPSAVNYEEITVGADDESTSTHRMQVTYTIYDDDLSNADHTYQLQSRKAWGSSVSAGSISINGYGWHILAIGKQ